MGWRTVVDVRDHSQTTGSTYTVLIMLAERAPDETRVARPGVEKLAQDSRVGKRTAQRALKEAEAMGEIVRVKEGHRGSAAEFYIAVGAEKGCQDGTQSRKGDTRDLKGANDDTERVPTGAEKGVVPVTPTEVEPKTATEGTESPHAQVSVSGLAEETIEAVLRHVGDVADAKKSRAISREAVVRACADYGDRDLVLEAGNWAHHWIHGRAASRPLSDPVRALRNWLGKADRAPAAPRSAKGAGEHPTDRKLREIQDRQHRRGDGGAKAA